MSRKTSTITIDTDNRDKGKTFLLTEMPAYQAESWATRAILALTNAGLDIPEEAISAGMAGMASIGFSALTKLDYQVVKPLLDEMLECAQIVMPSITRVIIHGDGADIEEVSTYIKLRKAIFELHLGFSMAALKSTSGSAAA
ncbi:MAG: hypothetical protein EOO69_04490 [Moraxellaceae bacterium]|nr:MAG: hypothetical protein EOO69_04490 [Moraxellaceae bacterium]